MRVGCGPRLPETSILDPTRASPPGPQSISASLCSTLYLSLSLQLVCPLLSRARFEQPLREQPRRWPLHSLVPRSLPGGRAPTQVLPRGGRLWSETSSGQTPGSRGEIWFKPWGQGASGHQGAGQERGLAGHCPTSPTRFRGCKLYRMTGSGRSPPPPASARTGSRCKDLSRSLLGALGCEVEGS